LAMLITPVASSETRRARCSTYVTHAAMSPAARTRSPFRSRRCTVDRKLSRPGPKTHDVRMTAEEPVLGNSDMNITRQRHVIEIEVLPQAVSMVVGNGIALTVPVESAPNAPTFAADPPHPNGAAAKTSAEPAPSEAAPDPR